MARLPGLAGSVRASRASSVRAVRYLTAEAGIRQFLDIGAGLPTANSTHQAAQSIAPDALVCYVDRDPVVFGHARALLASRPHGSTSYLEADLRDAGKILAEAAGLLDLVPAGGRGAECGPAVRPGQRPAPARSWPRCSTRYRRAASWCCPTRPAILAARRGPTWPARSAGCWPSRSPRAATPR